MSIFEKKFILSLLLITPPTLLVGAPTLADVGVVIAGVLGTGQKE